MNKIHRSSVGDRIKFARNSCKMSQASLAELLCVTQRTIVKWEKGETKPNFPVLKEISKVTGFNYTWILEGKGQEQTDGPADAEPSGHEITTNEELQMFLKDLVVAQAYIIELQKENKLLREEINSGGAIKKPQARRNLKN